MIKVKTFNSLNSANGLYTGPYALYDTDSLSSIITMSLSRAGNIQFINFNLDDLSLGNVSVNLKINVNDAEVYDIFNQLLTKLAEDEEVNNIINSIGLSESVNPNHIVLFSDYRPLESLTKTNHISLSREQEDIILSVITSPSDLPKEKVEFSLSGSKYTSSLAALRSTLVALDEIADGDILDDPYIKQCIQKTRQRLL